MSTNWVAVVVILLVGVGIGTLIYVFADRLSAIQQRGGRALGYSERVTKELSPFLIRSCGVGFILIGLLGAAFSLFFADMM